MDESATTPLPERESMAKILIVDDEAAFSSGVAEYLEMQGHAVTTTNSLGGARDLLPEQKPDAVLLDLMLPDGSGLELLDAFDTHRPEKVVIITGHSGVKSLIGGMAGDGVSFMKKPIEIRELAALVSGLGNQPAKPAAQDVVDERFGLMVGDSPGMRSVYDVIRQVAGTDSTVFIQGESGTGKELVAEAIHQKSKLTGQFVPVNCGSLTKDLLSSQLFGHEKGSFTGATRRHTGFFERADGGTLFPVNARLVAATNKDPVRAVRDGHLREDLYFRLRVFPIVLPPLRERKGDVALLAEHFLKTLNDKQVTNKQFSQDAISELEQHTWPGNVRELKHTVHRAFIMADGDTVGIPPRFDEDLPGEIEGLRVGRSIADVEKDLILATLKHLNDDKKAAAASLGISLKTLYNRLNDYEQVKSE